MCKKAKYFTSCKLKPTRIDWFNLISLFSLFQRSLLQQSCVTYNCRSLSSVHPLLILRLSSAAKLCQSYTHLPTFPRSSFAEVPIRFQSGSNEVPITMGGTQRAIHWFSYNSYLLISCITKTFVCDALILLLLFLGALDRVLQFANEEV